jgi:hypothetical protein
MHYLKTDSTGRHEILDGDDVGFSLNPFRAIANAASGMTHLASGAITTVAHLYQRVTPTDLQKILRWTPYGLIIRAGVKIAPATRRILGAAVKWSPQGMIYRGASYGLGKV